MKDTKPLATEIIKSVDLILKSNMTILDYLARQDKRMDEVIAKLDRMDTIYEK